jgi:hypothetical protein
MATTTIVASFLIIAAAYFVSGIIFLIPFLKYGLLKIDATAKSSGWGFRVIISPGVVLLWPVLLKKWLTVNRKKESIIKHPI